MPNISKIRLLIADDHPLVRSGIKGLLADTEIKIVDEASTGRAAVKAALEQEVDVVLLDICMPDGDGLAALAQIKLDKPKLPIVMLTAFDNPSYLGRAVALGASGYLLKDCSRDEFLDAIRTAASGRDIWTRSALRHVTGSLSAPGCGPATGVTLTRREGEVLRHITAGLTNEEIAAEMHVHYETVKEHVQRLLSKIGVCDRTQAALWALHNKLV